MLIARRLFYSFKYQIPELPYQITTIYKENLDLYKPPSARYLTPAVIMTAVSLFGQWNPHYLTWTINLLGIGWIFYILKSIAHSLTIKQIAASKDFRKLYIHFHGGWFANSVFKDSDPQLQYNKDTSVLEIPSQRIDIRSQVVQDRINFRQIYLMLQIRRQYRRYSFGPLSFPTNEIKYYDDEFKLFCYQRHEQKFV